MSEADTFDVVLVTCDLAPWVIVQRDALVAEFDALHCSVDVASWEDDRDWSAAAGIVVVSPFNTAPRYDDFVEWLGHRVEHQTVVNHPTLLEAGLHRRYLFDLEASGVPIVSTRQVAHHAPWQFQRAVLRRFSGRVVLKPAIAASQFGYGTFDADSVDAQAHLEALALLGDVVIQPYVSTADSVGVSQVVVLGGEISHAVRKMGSATVDHTLQHEERELVAMVMDALGRVPLAACIELVWIGDAPAVLSCDVVGPRLHAEPGSPALRRFARLALDTIHAPKIGGVINGSA